MISWVLAGIGGYLLGAIPSGFLLARHRGHNLHARGSGNTGTTNVLRSVGKFPAVLTLILDIGKGLAATMLAALFFGREVSYLAGLLAVAGHIYPVYLGFRGGKGLATGCGALLGVGFWPGVALFLPIWILVYLWRRKAAVASVIGLAFVALLPPILLPLWPLFAVEAGLALMIGRHLPELRQAGEA